MCLERSWQSSLFVVFKGCLRCDFIERVDNRPKVTRIGVQSVLNCDDRSTIVRRLGNALFNELLSGFLGLAKHIGVKRPFVHHLSSIDGYEMHDKVV